MMLCVMALRLFLFAAGVRVMAAHKLTGYHFELPREVQLWRFGFPSEDLN